MKKIQLLIGCYLFCQVILSQEPMNVTRFPDRIEKAFIHTDRPFYFPGETIWFKSYITNAHEQITTLSDIVYVELISPEGNSIQKGTYKVSNGYAFGQFDLNSNWVGGIYTLKGYTKWMLNQEEETLFTRKITVQKIVEPRLQMKFDFKKEAYGPGSNVQAVVALKDLENNILAAKKCTFTVSIDGQSVLNKKIVSNSKGELLLDFTLPSDLKTTDAIVNVLIPHQGNTESISRSIPVTLDTIDLQLLPESGILLANHKNTVAFKALNAYGKPADISGLIKDAQGVIVGNFESFHNGMGSFEFRPESGVSYTAHITAPFVSKKVYQLPPSQQKGINIHLDKLTEGEAYFSINSSENTTVEWCVNDVQETIFNEQLRLHKGTQKLVVPTANFRQGITKFTLQTTDGNYIAERLVFLNYDRRLNISITTDKESYNTREKTDVLIKTTDQHGNAVPSNLSIAVADNKLLSFADDRQDNITSYLLMSSELQGAIYKPNFYFDPLESKALKALDYVLLTHGWRSYLTEEHLNIIEATHQPERLTIQSGIVVDKNGDPIPAKLLLLDNNGTDVLPFETNSRGEFAFKLDNARRCTLLAYTDDGEKLEIIKNTALSYDWKTRNEQRLKNKAIKEEETSAQELLNKPNAKPIIQEAKSTANVSVKLGADNTLDEVVVVGYGVQREKKALGYAVTTVYAEELASKPETDIARLLQGRASGIQITQSSGVSGSGTNVIIRNYAAISGSSLPLYIVDGIPLIEDGTSDTNFIALDPSNIASVSVIKGLAATTLYGSEGRNGVFVITTKDNAYRNNHQKKKLNNAKYRNYSLTHFYVNNHRNYTTSRTFYIPVYGEKKDAQERTDFRSTIYWNPVIQTDKNGIATFSYHNADATTSYSITAQGVGANAFIGHSEKKYSVIKPLAIDFKLPPYLSIGDMVTISMVITNTTHQELSGFLNVDLPEEIAFAKAYTPKRITIPAKGFITKNITIIPKVKADHSIINANFTGDNYTDAVKMATTIVSPYFPIETSISGYKNGTYEVQLDNVVKGSLQAEFNLYTDVIGEVMDGVAALIRKPYGCFEQTSSSTYPNVMVLKYLRESGKSNPEIEAKALNYIKQGYKRLISFETKKGGFEWFGHTPPHETLTAFGILEFTEMKEVYPQVDDQMIARTVAWLMSRRDGQGGFKKSEKGYDSFASSPQDVANAYILYALSESGTAVTIEKEYQTAYQDAIKSKDSYKMALMASTAHNLRKTQDATNIMRHIKTNINNYGFEKLPVENTITRSYGNDKVTETIAFTILALLNEESPDQFLIGKAIKQLLNNRRGNRFGSTQATAMALKALIAYTKTQNQKLLNNNDVITVTINGKKIKKSISATSNGKIYIDAFEKHLKKGSNSFDFAFTNKEQQFPYSLNIKWDSTLPESNPDSPLLLETTIAKGKYNIGSTIRHTTKIKSTATDGLGMVTVIIGIPSGSTAQPWQLKELIAKEKVAFYEVFDNYIVLYWRSFQANETKTIALDLKAEIAGTYTAPASSVYLYYGEEFKHWVTGTEVQILKNN